MLQAPQRYWSDTLNVGESRQRVYDVLMASKVTMKDLTGLSEGHARFLIEYIKDFNATAAAQRAGYSPASAAGLVDRPDVQTALNRVLSNRLDMALIDAAWLKTQFVENHELARQSGNVPASNNALTQLAKFNDIDAFAAEKLTVSSDAELAERVERGRKRNAREDQEPEEQVTPPSFI